MKIRFGIALGAAAGHEPLADVVDALESSGVDSLWFPELVYSRAIDPTVGMAFALARTSRLKVGTSVAVLPGRHPVLVAKQLVSLAQLAPKRVLPAFGLRSALPAERPLFPVPDGARAEVFDESLRLLREVLAADGVSFSGKYFQADEVHLVGRPDPPLDIWIGGSAPAALRRVGRLGDGWLGSFLTPEEAGRARIAIQNAAADAGREIEPDHFGLSLSVANGDLPPELHTAIRQRRPGIDPTDLIAGSWDELRRRIDGYVSAGLTKFVISPAGKDPLGTLIDRFVNELLPLQN